MRDFFDEPLPERGHPVLRPHPLHRNPLFTGHDALLASLPERFEQTPVLILSGPEGWGKTEIAQEYACRFADRYETLLWLTASSRAVLSQNLEGILDWSASGRTTWIREDEAFTFFKTWLHTHSGWLLVLDHLDDSALLDRLIPPEPKGHLLITTHHTVAGLSAQGAASSGTLSESTRHLLQHAQPLVIGPAPTEHEDEDGTLPLSARPIPSIAVPTLGSSLTKALVIFEQRQAAFDEERDGPRAPFRQHEASLLLEEFIAFLPDHLIDVLRLLAFLPPGEASVQAALEIPEPLASVLGGPHALESALSEVEQEELVRRQGSERRLFLHPGLRVVLVESLTPEQQQTWAQVGARVRLDNETLHVQWDEQVSQENAPDSQKGTGSTHSKPPRRNS